MNYMIIKVVFILLLCCKFTEVSEKSQISEIPTSISDSFKLYCIGNSHTWDFSPSSEFLKIGESIDKKINSGWHINCGKNLSSIWNNPKQACVEFTKFGNFENAICDYQWDAITIQPFINGIGKIEEETIKKFYDFISGTKNKSSALFVYCTWPHNTAEKLSNFNYSEVWQSEYNKQDTLQNLSEKFFVSLEKSVNKYSTKVQYIRVGKVLYLFDQKAKEGQIPGFSGAGDLYRDAWHLNNIGRYIAGLTVFTTIFGIDPNDIPDFKAYPSSESWPSDRVLTSEQKKIVHSIISEVYAFGEPRVCSNMIRDYLALFNFQYSFVVVL